jgi:hypothetical protein
MINAGPEAWLDPIANVHKEIIKVNSIYIAQNQQGKITLKLMCFTLWHHITGIT